MEKADPHVRQLAEQWLRDQCLDLSRFCSLTELLEKVASHTRREALREAERAVLNVEIEPSHRSELVDDAVTAIRLLAEEKK